MTTVAVRATPRLAKTAAAANDDLPNGLTADEARRRLEKFGPNAMPDTALHPLRMAVEKFWAPVPWLPAWIVAGTLAAAAVFAVVLDLVKVPVFRRLGIT